MEEPFQQYDIFINNQGENITREKLKTYFDNIVDVMNALEDHDVYIQYVDTVATNLLNIDVDQLNKIIILDHPLILDLRNLTIELLQKQNYVYIKLITLFTNFYSKINKDILSKLHILFFHQPLLDALVHHRKNEEFADITDQFLTHLIQVHKTRFCSASLLDQTGVYLDEGVTYLCSSAYIDTFNHLFTRLGTSDENKLDSVEEFYLVICPSYVRLSGGNDRYMQASSMILEKMFRVYVNILTEFTKIIKKCSQAIIKSVTWLMNLLQCVSVFHEIRHKFINTSQDLIGVMWDIIFELSLQSEPYTHSLLDCTIGQMFCTTFEVELLPKIKQIDMIPTLLKLIDDGKPETIQFQSYRLLSVVMAEDEIQNQLTDAKKIIKIFFSDLSHSLGHALFKFRLENILFCLKNLIKNEQIKMEFIKQKGLPRLITYITNRNVKFSSTTARQRALEILLDLIVNERVLAFMKQDHLFLFHVKNLRLSSSEQGLQQAAQAIIEKLDTKEDLIEVAEKQDNLTNTSDTSAIANYDIIISYSYADIDSCRWISGQLMNDKFRVKFGLGLHRRSKVKTSTEAVEQSEIVLLCVSDSYLQNTDCQEEAQYAFEQQYRIIPLILKSSDQPIEWLRTIRRERTYIDFSKFEFKDAYEKLKIEIIQQKSQSKTDLSEFTEEVQFPKTELNIASSDVTSIDQKWLSTAQICPVSIHAFLSAIDDWYLLKSVPSEETFVLIWFDPNIENVDCKWNIFDQKISDFIRYYIDLNECISAIESIVTSKIVFVATAEIAQNVLHQVTSIYYVDSIILYSTNSEVEYCKPDGYPKVVGVYSNFNLLEIKIKHSAEELDKHLQMRRSFNKCKSKINIIHEFGDFLWFHIFIEAAQILYCGIEGNHGNHKHMELVSIAQTYYRGNSTILKQINDFSVTYRSENAIEWYTALNFPYKLLNKALRTENFELLIPFLFFIIDLKNCIGCEYYSSVKEKLTPNLFPELALRKCIPPVYHNLLDEKKVILYRGVKIPLEELDKFKRMKGELISINGFLSTSRSRKVAEMFSGCGNDIVGKAAVIFEIECDLAILADNFISADISKYSTYADEAEELIDIGAVFRLKNIRQDADGAWVIKMMPSNEVIHIAKKYIDDYQFILLSTQQHRRHPRFYALLSDRYRYENAQEHLEQLLDKPNGKEIAEIYATMTRTENPHEDREILVRDHYDYTRDRFSKEDFKLSARALNKIGFFLPRNEEIRNCQEILTILGVDEDPPDKSIAMESLTSVLPCIGDVDNKSQSLLSCIPKLEMLAQNTDNIDVALLKLKDECLEQGRYEEAQVYYRLFSDVFKKE